MEIELEILKSVLEFMNENCVGPQSSSFLYRSLKPQFETITYFSYSYFISLFDNKEMITSQLVKDKIYQYNSSSNDKENNENEKAIETHNKIRTTDNEDDYYYCTKTIRVHKYKMLKSLYQIFKDSGKTRIDIRDCYDFLKKEFNIKSFNMEKLKEFLQSDKFVLMTVVERLLIENTPESEQNGKILDLKEHLLNDREKWINIIDGLGIEYIEYLARNGINSHISFNNLVREIEPTYNFDIQLINPQNDKILTLDDYNVLFGFLKLFSEDELLEIMQDENSLTELLDMYIEEIEKNKSVSNFCKQLKTLLNTIHNDNRRAKIKHILPFEVLPALTQYDTIDDLIKEKEENLAFLYDYNEVIINYVKVLQQSLPAFLNEKFKLLLQRVNASNVPNSRWQKYVEILLLRSQGNRLKTIGDMYGHTREAIRSIEDKYDELFASFYNSPNGTLTRLIRSFVKNEWYMTLDDVGSIFNFYPELFYYLLKKEDCDDIEYIEELDCYYFIDNIDWYKELLSILDRIDGVLSEEQFKTTIQECAKYLLSIGVQIPLEVIEKVIRLEFKQNGKFYSRNKMGLLPKYKQILAKAFPDGIYIHEKSDCAKFREEYIKTFNDNKIPENDRALYGRIIACCYLVDKGKYALKKEKYISDELANKIYNYIQNSSRNVFLTNMLFATFENELKAEGVNNKYHLQGILKELFYDRLYFSRDYISKSSEATSMYNDICNYVKQFDGPVTLEQIMNEFKNVPFNVINTGLTNENIIKLSGAYIHVDKVNMTQEDIEYFSLAIDEILLENDYSNTHILYDYIKKNNKHILNKYTIDDQFKLFSLLQFYLQDQYEFRRPYFANKGVEVGHVKERVIAYIMDSKFVTFDEIKEEFPEVANSALHSILAIDEIICNQKSYMHIDNLHITEDDKKLLDTLVSKMCSDNNSHATHELLMVLDLKYPHIVNNYDINNQFKLFSILKCLFGDKYEFARPYFANKGIKILSKTDRITEFLRQNNEIKISDLYEYIYDNRLHIPSITEYINEMKDEYVFKDKDTIISLENSKLNKYNAHVAENVLLSAIEKEGFIVASKFKNYEFLPNDVKWTDWLLYSCINKFSSKIKVRQTESKMQSSDPIFVLKSIPAENADELKSYLKDKLGLNDIMFVKYLQNKGLLS